ncbi:hypothetical protein [Chamaesiphon minutus]|uniref:Uncharacterized protein n=1 Tax=Chamaesiphon minutus (strain ATCC 27169 / PCC 6605) TaxID=1173020 RepID=K9UM14_CHAP6|nr:hypothetical protein [Chamaesiphon minutus]AFY95481.1 hypothetical protein Cha6605_4562 [Chamaesiphon minutus PCC 6605]
MQLTNMEITADMVAKQIAVQLLTTINGVANGEVIISNAKELTEDQWTRVESIYQNADGTITVVLNDNTALLEWLNEQFQTADCNQ